jgi:16S rRNA (cytosine1402-N4)-methyltransferase
MHVPVLLTETLEALQLKPGTIVVDATFGGGGHSSHIIQTIGPTGLLYAFDQDPQVPQYAKSVLEKHKNIHLIQQNFSNMRGALSALGVKAVDAIVFDLGVSSFQLDDPDRGFSWKHAAPLDMRMDTTKGITAQELLAKSTTAELTKIITDYGEERTASFIAEAISQAKQKKSITTSLELKDIVHGTVRGSYEYRTSAVSRVFQALRIAVNKELSLLPQAVYDAITLLKPGGRIAVITFHSLEDRIVKYVFRMLAGKSEPVYGLPAGHLLELPSGKAIKPKYVEVKANPRARSAKLRVGERYA